MIVPQRTVRLEAPAKINLGLEILGRRDDGYHEIRSILAMIDLADTLTVTSADKGQPSSIVGMDLDGEANLIGKAAELLRLDLAVTIEKRIPMAAGLGGASADAAATLLAGNALTGEPRPPFELCELASSIGSDVPFFLGSPCALASGRGTDLAPLPVPEVWLVLVSPDIAIPGKTARLYGELQPEDFTDGKLIREQAERLRRGAPVAPALLHNAFSDALLRIAPEVADLQRLMRQAGCPFAALSGAGPTHYTIVPSAEQATAIAARLKEHSGPRTKVFVTRFRSTGLHIASASGDA
ncbi:MAG TPA: 4-(cytidine 5'-diphospho)-2-C-methyl-D-erythritol kinase [Thermomicrobiales bacterium]|nr:4-(cytidine 5'-diphospho)-2-C-methyl-D-erythritol kinase [Thermomicrobiales bacterium]